MKYNISVKPVVYWEGINVELETTADETEVLGKVTKEIYSAMMEALKPMIEAETTGMSIPTPTCTCSATTSETSFKEVEEEKKPEEKPVTKKAKKEKEKDDEDEYI